MVTLGEHKVDMHVSTLPTQYGEKIVMRLLGNLRTVAEFRGPWFTGGYRRSCLSPSLITTGDAAGDGPNRVRQELYALLRPHS